MKRILMLLVMIFGLAGVSGRSDASTIWQPPTGTTWYMQLQQVNAAVDMTQDVAVYDIDGFENPASSVTALHARGIRVVCYISAGSWENWRPDAGRFPHSVLGRRLDGWPGERWLDIRQLSVLAPLMTKRMQMCKAKGFDAVDFDNVDGYTNRTGFPLTARAQLRYNRRLAAEAHALGLAAALKNDLDQIPALVSSFDFSVDEQCFQYEECAKLSPFTDASKAVFEVEYASPPSCATAATMGLSAVQANLALDGSVWRPCW